MLFAFPTLGLFADTGQPDAVDKYMSGVTAPHSLLRATTVKPILAVAVRN